MCTLLLSVYNIAKTRDCINSTLGKMKTIYLSLSSLSWYMMGTLGDVIQDVFLDL